MAARHYQRYGVLEVGQRVVFERQSDSNLIDVPANNAGYTIIEMQACDAGVIVSLREASSMLKKAFDNRGQCQAGHGRLRILKAAQ